jgi:chromosome segregation ATPase
MLAPPHGLVPFASVQAMESPLEFVRTVEAGDAELANLAARIEAAQREIDSLAERAAEIVSFRERLPAERARLQAEVESARAASDTSREAVERARGLEGEDAQRLLQEAEDAARHAERLLRRAEAHRVELDERAAAAQEEIPTLEERAREAASSLATIPALASRDVTHPGSGLGALLEWAPRARAAAFVTKGQIDREREALIRQANEAATAVLGEPSAGASVSVVRRRLESAG